jgi:hypothetical protein
MKLEENGNSSSGKCTRYFDIKYTIKYCPTEEMVADFMTKPLTGAKFHKFRKAIMNNG